jgi:hypothetical protein
MRASPGTVLDLPLKMLIWQNWDGIALIIWAGFCGVTLCWRRWQPRWPR